MNNAKPSTPACQDRPDRAHQRRNNAIECAYAFVVDSAASRPNRRCRRYPSATPTTCRSSSSTVQYRCPDGKLTGSSHGLSLSGRQSQTTTSHEHHTPGETPNNQPNHPDRATSRHRSENPGEGVRVGEALGLRHEDVAIAEKTITITPRDNDNRARAKTGSRTIPSSPELMRLYADYLNRGVRGAGLGLRVCQSVVGAAGPAVVVFGGPRPGGTSSNPNRYRFRTPSFPPHLRDLAACARNCIGCIIRKPGTTLWQCRSGS